MFSWWSVTKVNSSTNRRWWDNRIWSLFWIAPDYPENHVSDRFIQVQQAESRWKEALFLSRIAGGISVSDWFRSRDRPRKGISVLAAGVRIFRAAFDPPRSLFLNRAETHATKDRNAGDNFPLRLCPQESIPTKQSCYFATLFFAFLIKWNENMKGGSR